MNKTRKLNITYGAIQALYYATFCAMSGYASVYMLGSGISNSVIGLALALANVFAFVIQPFVAAYLDDHKEIPLSRAVAIMLAIILLGSAIAFISGSASGVVTVVQIVLLTVGLCILPLINSMAFTFEKHGYKLNFSIPRGIGSGAYATASLFLGWFFTGNSTDYMPVFFAIFASAMLVSIRQFRLPKEEISEQVEKTEEVKNDLSLAKFVVRYKKFMIVVAGCFFLYIGHLAINNFFFQIITNVGGNSGNMGVAVSIAAYLEIPVMFMFTRINNRFSLNKLFIFSGVMYLAKTVLTWLAPNVGVIYFAQVLQMFAYAPFILCTVYYVNEAISPADQIKGQSFMTMSMTLAGIIASLSAGLLIDNLGVNSFLLVATVMTAIGTGVLAIGIVTNNSNLIHSKNKL